MVSKLPVVITNPCCLLSVQDVINRYPDVNRHDVIYAIKTGKLKALKSDWSWLVKEEDLPQSWNDLGIKRKRIGVTKRCED